MLVQALRTLSDICIYLKTLSYEYFCLRRMTGITVIVPEGRTQLKAVIYKDG